MDDVEELFQLVTGGDLEKLEAVFDDNPWLIHCRRDQGEDRRSLLQVAAAEGDLDICQLLVDRGAEVYPNAMNQYPPVMEARWKKHEPIVDYFLKEIPHLADGTYGQGITINLAAREGFTDIVRNYLELDPLSVHYRGWIGDTPLHWPSHNNHEEIVSILIEAGADIEADEINWVGGKPLHWASEHAPGSVRLLLEAGADVNSRNVKEDSEFFQVTPLIMNATQKDDCAEVTELLLEAGADLDAVDGNGLNALEHAEKRGLEKITGVLRAAG